MHRFLSRLVNKPSEESSGLDLLATVPIFADLSRSELRNVERILYRRVYEAGERIFLQGDPGVGMYIIAEGRVRIDMDPGGTVLAELDTGSFFGEVALLNEIPRTANATAIDDCTVWGFFHPELIDLLERKPRLGVKILLPLAQIAGRRLLALDEELRSTRVAPSSMESE
jgi:CRP/FNR family transcriptional regulator, cyclic AMP receptor protein